MYYLCVKLLGWKISTVYFHHFHHLSVLSLIPLKSRTFLLVKRLCENKVWYVKILSLFLNNSKNGDRWIDKHIIQNNRRTTSDDKKNTSIVNLEVEYKKKRENIEKNIRNNNHKESRRKISKNSWNAYIKNGGLMKRRE